MPQGVWAVQPCAPIASGGRRGWAPVAEGAESSHHWQAISAAAAVVAALVALAAYLWPRGSGPVSPGPPTVTSAGVTSGSQSAGSTETASSGPVAHGSPSASGPIVLGQGVLRMSDFDDSSVDVGVLPLTLTQGSPSSFYVSQGLVFDGLAGSGLNLLAAWSGPGKPTAAGCENLLRTQATSSLTNHAGLVFCTAGVSTARVAACDVLSYDGSVSQVQITVWAEQ